jgi:hypothetical protein
MIKFFRKIRKNLLSEGKTGKYFKYAIGEILLVVIGILIALSINNWNENRKSRKSENQILNSLAMDFNSNLSSLEESLVNITELIEKYSLVLEYAGQIDNGLTKIMEEDIRTTGFIKTNIIDGSLNALISSNLLELVANDGLKELLTSYSSHMTEFKEQEHELIKYVTDTQRPLLRSYLTLSDFLLDEPRFNEFKINVKKSDYEGLLKNQDYLNVVIGIRAINMNFLNSCKEFHKYTEEIKLILETEITKG